MAVLRILAKKLNNAGRRLEEAVLSLGIIVLAVFLIANAIGRKMGLLIYFVDELAVFLVILVTFVGLSYAVRKARHVRMAAIYDLVPEKIQKAMMLAISFVTALAMFYMAYLATTYVVQVYTWGQVAPTLRMPYWIGIAIVPVGFFFAGIYYVLTFAKNISIEGAAWSGSEQQSEYE
ncbi:Ectoine/5-hydroxyectoine TRAP transporter small permease protein UehB [subsurface metagenome]